MANPPSTGGGNNAISIDVTEVGLSALITRLRNAGVERELEVALRRAARPMADVARQGARDTLPRKGGLAEVIAATKFSTTVRISGNNVVAQVIGRSRHDLAALDRGRDRHPVFGNRKVWVNQRITPGWFSRSERTAEAIAMKAMEAAAERVARKLT